MKHNVFVYGTLKSGFGNHRVMAMSKGAEFIGDAQTTPEYTMVSLGGFPGVIAGGNTAVQGELWSVEDLSGLDMLEGHPDFYTRTEVMLDGYPEPVYIYLLGEEYLKYDKIEDGVWKSWNSRY